MTIPRCAKAAFTAAEGWGVFAQRRADGQQTHDLEIKHGRLALREFDCELPEGAQAASVTARIGDKAASVEFALTGQRLRVTLAAPITLAPGSALRIDVRLA